ncbi:ap2-like ethylene-responsive transcription factor [Quercus suber]|uniref:Ap2-like ethylene-responsive transcription factor n=1 Tax=Quercus suber TaxID=58331 RepID=A0AAW0JH02_QUESU
MASSSSDPGLKSEAGGGGGGGGSSGEAAMVAKDELFVYRGGLKKAKKERGCTAKERISKMPPCAAGKRSSIYRGVTRHRWTGAYDEEEAAARAYDLAALKYWGPGTLINFPVTDYTRDLEEMQNVSREEYLASLRRCVYVLSEYILLTHPALLLIFDSIHRKSSGFSRGISKYRGLSSRWEPFGRMGASEYFNSTHYGTGDDPAAESEYLGNFCSERKIDLTMVGANKTRQSDAALKSSEETKHAGDIGVELKTLELAVQPTEPYQMPCLGMSNEMRKHKGSTVSALSILSRSAAYKSMEEKASKKPENSIDNDENEDKNTINKVDYGKAVEKSTSLDVASERLGVALGMSGGMSLQRNAYPLTPFLSAPLLTNYNTVDPLADPILWTSLVPVLPSGLSRTAEVTKTETSSTYTNLVEDNKAKST